MYNAFPHLFVTFSATFLGIAQAAYDGAVTYLTGRMPGAPVPHTEIAAKGQAIAEMLFAVEAARALGVQIVVFNASTISEINAAFAALAREHADALFVAADAFFDNRRVQFATLAARDRVPANYVTREHVEAGGLMSYGTSIVEMFRQVGVYTGSILNGAKPADLPVLQPTKFEFVINLKTAKALGLAIPETLLATADEVIQ